MHMKLAVPWIVWTVLAACDEGAARPDSGLVKQLETLRGEACACKDLACADGVADKVTKLGEANKDFDREEIDKLQAIQKELDRCLATKNPTIVAYVELAKAACACKDKACGRGVADKIARWASDLKTSGKKLRAGDANVAMTEGKRAGECLTRLGVPFK